MMPSVNRIQHIIHEPNDPQSMERQKVGIMINSVKRKTVEQLSEYPSNWKFAQRHKSNNIKYQRRGLIIKINYHDR